MILSFFEWCEATAVGTAIRQSLWLFPAIEAVHLLGLCLLGGAILIVDLRLLGVGLRNQPIGGLIGQARPWLITAVIVMGATGLLLFLSEAVKCYYNQAFWVKITTLPVAVVFTFYVRGRIARTGTLDTSARSRAIGVASLVLWFTVAAAGRWIGFSS